MGPLESQGAKSASAIQMKGSCRWRPGEGSPSLSSRSLLESMFTSMRKLLWHSKARPNIVWVCASHSSHSLLILYDVAPGHVHVCSESPSNGTSSHLHSASWCKSSGPPSEHSQSPSPLASLGCRGSLLGETLGFRTGFRMTRWRETPLFSGSSELGTALSRPSCCPVVQPVHPPFTHSTYVHIIFQFNHVCLTLMFLAPWLCSRGSCGTEPPTLP